MKLNEAVSFRRKRFRTVGSSVASVVALIGAGLYSVSALIAGIYRYDEIRDFGPAPFVAATLAPISMLMKFSEWGDNREATHVHLTAEKLLKVVEERDIIFEGLEDALDKEEYIQRHHRKIVSLTKKQQSYAKKLEEYLSSRDARSFIRDKLTGSQINQINLSIERAKQGTLHGLVFDRQMNESFSFINLTTPKIALTRLVNWSLVGAASAAVYSVSSASGFQSPAVLAALVAVLTSMRTVGRVGEAQLRELGNLVRELERIVEERDFLFDEYVKLSTEEERNQWMSSNSRTVARLTKRQSAVASKIEALFDDPRSVNFIDNLPDRLSVPMKEALAAAKKGTISSVLSDRRINESFLDDISGRSVNVANLENWGASNNVLYILGYPGDGKSTLAREIAERTGAVRVNGDKVYNEMKDQFNPTDISEDPIAAWHNLAKTIIQRHTRGRMAIVEGAMVGTFAPILMDASSPVISFDSSFLTSLMRAAKRDKGAILGTWMGYLYTTFNVKQGARRWLNETNISFRSMTVSDVLEKVK